VFFIAKGRVSFIVERYNIAFKDMIEGGYFGEIDILFKRHRSFTVISAVETELLTLTRDVLEYVIAKEH
jgi:CRP-like cAMP-binding protein